MVAFADVTDRVFSSLETLSNIDRDRDLNRCLLVTFPFLQISDLIRVQFHTIIRFVGETWLVINPKVQKGFNPI